MRCAPCFGTPAVPRPARHVALDSGLDLPKELVVNGFLRSLQPDAHYVGRAVTSEILQRWPTFGAFFGKVLAQIEEHYRAVGVRSAAASAANDEEAAAAEEVFDFPRYVLPLFREEAPVAWGVLGSARAGWSRTTSAAPPGRGFWL